MDIFLVLQIVLITTLSIVVALAFLTLCKRFWLAALLTSVVTGGIYTLCCMIYMVAITPEGMSYWDARAFGDIPRMFVFGFVIALTPVSLVLLWRSMTRSKIIIEP